MTHQNIHISKSLKSFHLFFLLLLFVMGAKGVYAMEVVQSYKRAITADMDHGVTAWSGSDIGNSGTGVWVKSPVLGSFVIDNTDGLKINSANGSRSLTLATSMPTIESTIMTYDMVWNLGASYGDNGTNCHLNIGNNITITTSSQAQSGQLTLGSTQTNITGACIKDFNRDGDVWTIHVVINTRTNTVTELTISGSKSYNSNGDHVSFSLGTPAPLNADATYETVSIGTTRIKGEPWTALRSISITESKWSYVVRSNQGIEIASGSGVDNEVITYAYPRYTNVNGTLYFRDKNNTSDYYHRTLTLDSDKEETLDYTVTANTPVIYFREAEDVMNINTEGGNTTRNSYGAGGFSSTDVNLISLPNGCYQVVTAAFGKTTFTIKADGETIHTQTVTGSWGETSPTTFSLDHSAMITATGGGSSYSLDYIFILGKLLFSDGDISGVVGDTRSPYLYNWTGSSVSYSSNFPAIASVDANTGALSLNSIGKATVTVTAGDYSASYLVTVKSSENASGAYTYNSDTHQETFTVSGTGNLREQFKGKRITFDVGNPDELQLVNGNGLYCLDNNGSHTHVFAPFGVPTMGTYYAFTPKYNGYLSISATASQQNGIRLVSADGTLLETIAAANVTANTEKTYSFATRLDANQTYYVYAETGAMSGSANNYYPTLYLRSFTFDSTQDDSMTINVSDLLYPTVDGGINSMNNKLDRTIPGFTLAFSGGDGTTVYNNDRITFYQNSSGVGQLVITPRLKGGASEGDVLFTGVTLNYTTIESGKATSALVNGQTAAMPAGSNSASITLNTPAPTLTIRYGSDSDDNSFVLTSMTLNYRIASQSTVDAVLDKSRTATLLSFDKSEYYVNSNHSKEQPAYFTIPANPQGYQYGTGFNGTITYSSADTDVATVANDGTVTMLATTFGSQTTISAQFEGTSYFLPSSVVSYTVKSSLALSEGPYTISSVKRGMVVEVQLSTDGTSELGFTHTIADYQQIDNSINKIENIAYENNGSDEPFEVEISQISGEVFIHSARAYYKKPEVRLNYTPQAIYNHHTNWTDATLKEHFANNQDIESCFDLKGVPYFTAIYDGKDLASEFSGPNANSEYEKTGNIEFVTSSQTTIPKGTIRSTGNGSTITEATVYTPVSLLPTALGYDPNDANNQAVAYLNVIPFPYTWDFASGTLSEKTKALELHNVTDNNSNILLGPGSVMVESIGNLGKKAYNYYIDTTLPNSRVRIPVMQGMKVSVTSHGAQERVTGKGYPLQISNVTDLRGYATATLEIKTTSNTQEFIAKSNGYVEIYNRSDVNVYLESITVSAPDLVFDDGTNPKVSKTTVYQNRVLNKPTEATLTFDVDEDSNAKIVEDEYETTGTFSFKSDASGDIVVTATTGHTAKALEPCWGQYTITLANFYFNPSTIHLVHGKTVSPYHANYFLSYAKLILNDREWSTLSNEEKSKISFSVAAPSFIDNDPTKPNFAKGIVEETGNVNDPYIMDVRNDGQLIITAVYRESASGGNAVKTTCTVNITKTAFEGFKYPAPTVASTETTYDFALDNSKNPLDADTRNNVTSYRCTYIGKNTDQPRAGITVSGTTILIENSGVYHVEALNGTNTIADFYLTKAYPVNISKWQTWDFRQGVSSEWGTSWGQMKDPTNGYNVDEGAYDAIPYFQYATWMWTRGMPTNRASDYRCVNAVNGNNGFIVKETSGLLVIADAPTCDPSIIDGLHCDGHFSAYTGETYNYVYPNIGLHKATLIIPHLPKGAYVAVAWDRTSEGDGNTVILENLLDLEGHTIDVIKFGGSVRLTGNNAGNNQGYYTFRVANDGNVTFTQNDKGTSRIVAIHVYYGSDPDDILSASDDPYYNRNAIEEFKGSGMTQKIMAYAEANKDGTANVNSGLMQLDGILTTDGETTSQWLTNYLNFSAPNGVAEFKMVNQDETLHNMTMDMSQTYFDSGNGTYAVPGLSFIGACWGKATMSVGVRDGNGYLVAYRQYRFTVGVRPKMSYPKTWDFTRFFDNSTVKIEDSPVTVLPATEGLNTKNSLVANSVYYENTENPNIPDTEPTRTWDFENEDPSLDNEDPCFKLKRNSGTATYHQYGYNDYSSYYVDDAMLVCNLGERNDEGFIIEETRGLGFNIENSTDNDNRSLKWAMPSRAVGYAEQCYLKLNGTMTIAGIGKDFEGYYVFIRSSRAPDACSENLKEVTSGEYKNIVLNSEGQYLYKVNSPANMSLTFNSDTKIYGISVTNLKKDALHPVGGTGWATESRIVDIDHTLSGYYTKHPLKAYEVKYDSYDMNTATVYLTEIKKTVQLTDSKDVEFYDHGYVPQGNGIVLKEVQTDETTPYVVPLFVPAITTTHPAAISNDNMMRPNIRLKKYLQSDITNDNIFILTNVHWKYAVDSEWSKSGDNYIESRNGNWQDHGAPTEADAAGFYRLHIWGNDADDTMAANTAYLLVDSDDLPIALWNTSTAGSRVVKPGTIGIRELGVVDGLDEVEAGSDVNSNNNDGAWYTLDGMKLNGQPTKSGLYIHNGRKVVK